MSNTEQKRTGRRSFRKPPKWKIIVYSLIIVGAVVSMIFLEAGHSYRVENWETATATVVDWERTIRGAGRTRSDAYIPIVEFEVDGEVFTNRLSSQYAIPHRGTEIEIRYDPDDPEGALLVRYRPDEDEAFNWGWVFLPLAALCFIGMIEKISRPPKRDKDNATI